MGAEKVILAYRRSEDEILARREEYHHARAEGIDFQFLTTPIEIIGNENGRTNIKDIFAGGDIVTGAATVISAMCSGRKAGKAIDEYLKLKY